MKKRLLLFSPVLVAGVVALAGCGGGSSSVATRSISGTATLPGGLSRAVGTLTVLPGATVSLYDVTKGGPQALSGTPVATATTDSNGNFHFGSPWVTSGDNYFVKISATVHDSTGKTINITMGSYAHVDPAATGSTKADVNQSSTVAASDIFNQIVQNPALASTDLSATFTQIAAALSSAISNVTIDLTANFTDPNQAQNFLNVIAQVVKSQIPGGTYVDNGPDSGTGARNNMVDMVVDTTKNKVTGALVVLDQSQNVFDVDFFSVNYGADGSFSTTTMDGLYTIQGNVVGGDAHGTWAAVNGSASGKFETVAESVAARAASVKQGYAYLGTFAKNGATSPLGYWMVFVRGDGKAWMFAYDSSKTSLPHLLREAVITGTVSSTGAVTGHMVFPVNGGSVTGTTPLAGGTVTGTGSGSAGGKTLSGTDTISGNSSNGVAQGTWNFSGLRNGSNYNAAGTWTGNQF